MSNNKDLLSQIGEAFLLYKLRWVILAGIIFLVAIYFIVSPQVDKEYQQYGYTGLSDNIKYDEFTGEIIPKEQIATYDNSDKFIINSKGNKITVAQIEELVKQYSEIQGSYASFNETKKDSLDNICNTLLREYLDLDYEIRKFGGENSHNYRFQIVGDYSENYYSDFSTPSDLRSLSKEVFKDKYCKQNGIDK